MAVTQLAVEASDIIVDNTLLSAAPCSTKLAMRHVLGLTTEGEAKELRAGSAVHEALAWWLCGQGEDKALERLTLSYKAWAAEHVAPDDRLAFRPVKRILKHWFQQHPLEKWNFVVKPEEVEMPLAAELGRIVNGSKVVKSTGPSFDGLPRVVMVALLDALAKMRTGGRWSVDHKTTGNTGEYFKNRQEDSSQFTGQLWLAKQRGLTLSGIYINAIHLKPIPGSTYKCKTHGGVPYAECGLKHMEHKLFPITRTAHEIDAWELTARGLAKKYVRLLATVSTIEDVRRLPMEGRFAGMCGFCPFREWCRLGRPAGAARTFAHDPWHPLEHAQRHVDAIKEARE